MLIYLVTNKASGKRYVGQTRRTAAIRFNGHCQKGAALTAAIKKYGKEAFSVEIIGNYASKEDLNVAEAYFIAWHNCIAPNGYNLTSGGEDCYERSAETKLKISQTKQGVPNPKVAIALKGRRLSIKTEFKGGHIPDQFGDKNHMFGKPASNLGVPHSRQTKDKISEAMTGKMKSVPKSEEHKRKISEALKARFGGAK